MTAAMRAPRLLTFVLAAANVAMAALALWPTLPQATRAAYSPAVSADSANPALVRLAAFADYAATVNRPLFSPSRRPPPGGTAHALGGDGRFRLEGLVITGTTRQALIAETASGRSVELGEGQAIGGWVVKRITLDGVVLASPTGDTTLTLGTTGALPPTAKP